MKMRKNGAMTKDTKRKIKRVASFIAPLYFFALFIAGLILALIFK